MFNDEDLMDQRNFPTMFSLIETEGLEAHIVSSFLEHLGIEYMDIWYSELSADMAGHLYDEYIVEHGHGCARKSHLDLPQVGRADAIARKTKEVYNTTGGNPSKVQLLLLNSASATTNVVRDLVQQRNVKDTLYVLGVSNGRTSFHSQYADLFKSFNDSESHDMIMTPLPFLLNANMSDLNEYLRQNWEDIEFDDKVDKIYEKVSNRKCGHDRSTCRFTSWLGYVTAGVKIVIEALRENLEILKRDGSPVHCTRALRRLVYQTIIDEEREVEFELDNEEEFHAHFHDRTIHSPYQIKVYQTSTDEYHVLGTAHKDEVHIDNPSVLALMSSYPSHCSADCVPGTFRMYDPRTLAWLPCCWSCTTCPHHSISNKTNASECSPCGEFEDASDDNTYCFGVEHVFIQPSSPNFIAVLSGGLIGLGLVVAAFVIIVKNETRPVIKASDPCYLYLILLGLGLGFCTSIIPLLRPSQSTCTAEQTCFIIFMTLITSNLVWKCGKIYGIFAAANSFKKPKFAPLLKRAGQTWINIGSLTVGVLIVVVEKARNLHSWSYQELQLKDHQPIFPMCSIEQGSNGLMLVLPLVLPLICFIITLVLAFKMRNFPHNFRETLNIFAATLVVALCCSMFLSGYSLAPYEIRALLRAIVMFVTCLAFLVCLYLPKMVILLKKNVNTAEERAAINQSLQAFAGKGTLKKNPVSKLVKRLSDKGGMWHSSVHKATTSGEGAPAQAV